MDRKYNPKSNHQENNRVQIESSQEEQVGSVVLTKYPSLDAKFENLMSDKLSQYKNQQQLQILKPRAKQIDFKPLIVQNIQLRQENKRLEYKVGLLEQMNQSLIDRLIKAQQLNYGRNKQQVINSQLYQENRQFPRTIYNDSEMSHLSTHQIKGAYNSKDQCIQEQTSKLRQYCQARRPASQSPLNKYFNYQTKILDVSYRNLTINQFKQQFVPFDWCRVQVLKLDGNMLGTEGFYLVTQAFWPNLRLIQAGYNQITDVDNLQNFPKLAKVDLRANPLSPNAKFYLQKLNDIKQVQIRY